MDRVVPAPAHATSPAPAQVVVRHGFKARRAGELTVVKGEMVELVAEVDSNWVQVLLLLLHLGPSRDHVLP